MKRIVLAALLVALTAVLSAQSQPRPSQSQRNGPQESTDKKTLPSDLRVPSQEPRAEAKQADSQPLQRWYENPEWWQVILIFFGTIAAVLAFWSERRAVRVTQRADLFIEKLEHDADDIQLTFKNHGKTRASDIECVIYLDGRKIPPRNRRQAYVLTAGSEMTEAFGPFGSDRVKDITTRLTYRDVFGRLQVLEVATSFDPADKRIRLIHRIKG